MVNKLAYPNNTNIVLYKLPSTQHTCSTLKRSQKLHLHCILNPFLFEMCSINVSCEQSLNECNGVSETPQW